jgi:hypothetical protein
MVFLTPDVFVIKDAFAAIEDGLGHVGHAFAIDQSYVVVVSASGQEKSGQKPGPEPGPLAWKKGWGESGVHLAQMLFNAHNRLGCLWLTLTNLVRAEDNSLPTMSMFFEECAPRGEGIQFPFDNSSPGC